MEAEVINHLLTQAEDIAPSKEFEGFEEREAQKLLEPVESNDSRVTEPEVPTEAPSFEVFRSQRKHVKEGDLRQLVDQVVSKMAPVIKSLCVTERMIQIQVSCFLGSL